MRKHGPTVIYVGGVAVLLVGVCLGRRGCLYRVRDALLVVSAVRVGALQLFVHHSASSGSAHYE